MVKLKHYSPKNLCFYSTYNLSMWFVTMLVLVASSEALATLETNLSGQGDCLKINEKTEDFITTHPQDSSSKLAEEVDVKTFVLDEPYTIGHMANLSGLSSSFSLLEPVYKGSCKEDPAPRRSIVESAYQHDCLLAVNTNYFNESSGACFGNMISEGEIVKNDNHDKNPTFCLMKNGSALMGYIAPERLSAMNMSMAIQGMIWLLKNGENIVNKSLSEECGKWLSVGIRTLHRFATVTTARVAIGTDKHGNVLIIQTDGKTLAKTRQGLSLHDFAEVLISYGMYNAINLDGGGSTTMFYNGTVINYPADVCGKFRCAREVSAFFCLRRTITIDISKQVLVYKNYMHIIMVIGTIFIILWRTSPL